MCSLRRVILGFYFRTADSNAGNLNSICTDTRVRRRLAIDIYLCIICNMYASLDSRLTGYIRLSV